MNPLSSPLPLRRTTVWGAYRDDVFIAHRFGVDVTGALIPYNVSRTVWVWADHAVGIIRKVTVAGQSVTDWQASNGLDSTGRVVAFVEFGQPPDLDAEVIATGDGMPHPVRGGVMQNPAALVWHILANLAGWPATEPQLDVFRVQCDAAQLVAAGSIETNDSPQTIVRALCTSVGAVFAADAPYLCQLWPGVELTPPRDTLDHRHTVKATCSLPDICNDLTLTFDYQNGRPRQALQMEAPDSVVRYGRAARSLAAPWLTSGRTAYGVALRSLQQQARPQWDVAASGLGVRLRPLDAVTLAHAVLPIGGQHLVQARTFSSNSGETAIGLDAAVGDLPRIRLVRISATFEDVPLDLGLTTVGSERVLTLRDLDTLAALVGAEVTVDGTTTRTTNSAGQVSFPAAVLDPGEHRLDIVTADGRRFGMVIVIGADGSLLQTILIPPNAPAAPEPPPYYSG